MYVATLLGQLLDCTELFGLVPTEPVQSYDDHGCPSLRAMKAGAHARASTDSRAGRAAFQCG